MYFTSDLLSGRDSTRPSVFNGEPSIIKTLSLLRTNPNRYGYASVLNCFPSSNVLLSKSQIKHVSLVCNTAQVFHSTARRPAQGRGIGIARRVHVLSTGLNT